MIEFLVRRLASADNDRHHGECRAHGLPDSAALTSHESCIHHDHCACNTTRPKYAIVVRPSLQSSFCFPRIGSLRECASSGDWPLPCLRCLSRDTLNYTISSRAGEVESPPSGTFYVWANLSRLPAPLNDGMVFFEEGLKEKVITVPGIFFDVNPEQRRAFGRYGNYSRISFGPEMAKLELGLDSLERMIAKHS